MFSVEVDFEVYKQLTVRRASEEVTNNDVIRELLGLKPSKATQAPSPAAGAGITIGSKSDWVTKGVRFPAGTEFRATYKGRVYTARVEVGGLMLNGHLHDSPSSAAVSITKTSVNGWRFWECKLPGKQTWQLIEGLRHSS